VTTGVLQTNIEGNSPENEGNANYDEGNINNDEGNDPGGKGTASNDEVNPSKNDKDYGNIHDIDYDKISIKNGSTEDPQITINDINIIEEVEHRSNQQQHGDRGRGN